MFDADKTRMIGLTYGEELSHVKPFSSNTGKSRTERERETDRQTDRQTDGQTDRIAISISRVSVLTRDKNRCKCESLAKNFKKTNR